MAIPSLRRLRPLFLEIGLVITLGLLILTFRANLQLQQQNSYKATPPVVVQIENIIQTDHIPEMPPPPRPALFVVVPNNTALEDDDYIIEEIDFTASIPKPPAIPPDQITFVQDTFIVVEEMPVLIGGLEAVLKDVKYPELAKKAGIEGTVFIQFIVDKQGHVTNAKVVKGIGAGCDEEALRAVRNAKFEPGRQRGKPVNVKFSLPVRFMLR